MIHTTVLTLPEYATAMRVSEATIYRLLRGGAIPGAFKVGRAWRIPANALPDTTSTTNGQQGEGGDAN
jgi:excisionase family DNA binding protein